MPKVGRTVDAETAELIVNNVTRFIYASTRLQSHVLNMRPVIWTEERAQEAISDSVNVKEILMCQRDLCHLICLDDEIRIMAHLPQYHSKTGAFLSAMVLEYRSNYDGKITHDKPALIYTGSSETKTLLEQAYKRAAKELGAKISDHIIICLLEVLEKCDSVQDGDEAKSLIPFFQASCLESFAFSPYTTIRQRPTLRQAMNRNANGKEKPAIEVVRLRIAKKHEDSQPTGRKINCRYDVVEHLRRQPTKEGIKVITIAAHSRGPLGAPVKPPRKKVYKVVK